MMWGCNYKYQDIYCKYIFMLGNSHSVPRHGIQPSWVRFIIPDGIQVCYSEQKCLVSMPYYAESTFAIVVLMNDTQCVIVLT